jgi:hypothetical protein
MIFQRPLLAPSHSIGGHALALNHGRDTPCGFVTIASNAGVTASIRDRGVRIDVAYCR